MYGFSTTKMFSSVILVVTPFVLEPGGWSLEEVQGKLRSFWRPKSLSRIVVFRNHETW